VIEGDRRSHAHKRLKARVLFQNSGAKDKNIEQKLFEHEIISYYDN
jgi:hypothetical protein